MRDRLVIMGGGLIIAEGTPAALVEEHVSPQVLEFRTNHRSLQDLVPILEAASDAVERTGDESILAYTDDADALLERVRARGRRSRTPFTARQGWRMSSCGSRGGGWSNSGYDKDTLARGSFRVWQRNITIFRKYWKTILFPNFVEPLLYLAALGLGLGAFIQQEASTASPTSSSRAPGLLASNAMFAASFESTFNTFVKLKIDKILRRHNNHAGQRRGRGRW